MINFGKKFNFTMLLSTMFLSACGGSNNSNQSQPVAAKLLDVIEDFSVENNQQTQTSLYKLSYGNGRLARVDFFDDSGVDKKWNTSDDSLYGYSTCEFSGKITEPVRDPSIEFTMPNNPWESSVTGSIIMAILGIKYRHYNSLCAMGYQDDQSFKEQEFNYKGEGDYQPVFYTKWQAKLNQVNLSGTEISTYLLSEEFAKESEGSTKTYQYLGTDYLADVNNKKLFQYIKQNGQLKTINIYNYTDTPEIAVANLNRQVKTASVEYTYEGNQTRICHKDSDGTANALYVNSYHNGQITQAEAYAKGIDQSACTADDVVIKRTVYKYS